MKNINLIPPDVQTAQQVRQRLRFWITVNIAVAGVLVCLTGLLAWNVRVEKLAAGELDTGVTGLQGLTLELEQLRDERSTLAREERALSFLLDRAPDYDLVRAVAEAVADNGWLMKMEISRYAGEQRNRERGSGRLVLEGHAGSYSHLAKLMSRLDALEYVASVDLKQSQRGQAAGVDAIQFELECLLAPGT
ncbi:MAG: PilN domain-containing protein [Candidatus Eisenbacteria sp.]|nr:PilN domain-containing protein [Candidatus Eisenbacteria bacterium]